MDSEQPGWRRGRDASALAEELLAVDEGWWERSQCSSEVRLLGRVDRVGPWSSGWPYTQVHIDSSNWTQ